MLNGSALQDEGGATLGRNWNHPRKSPVDFSIAAQKPYRSPRSQ
jgi:hypothetical protein